MFNIYSDDISAIGLDGKPVKRSKEEYPYSYDTFIVWKSDVHTPNNKGKTVYSDRLPQWDLKKYDKCCKEIWGNVSRYFDDRAPAEIEEFLSKYLNKKIKLYLIAESCNQLNGFPIWMFCYENIE